MTRRARHRKESTARTATPAVDAAAISTGDRPGARRAGARRDLPAAAAIVLLGLLDVYLLATRVGPLDGVWSIDQGTRIEQIQSLIATRYRSLASVYAGDFVDPKHAYTPLLGQYLYRYGKSFSMFSAPSAALSSVPFRLVSYPGLYVVPVGSTLLLLAVANRLTRRILPAGGRAALILALGLATPLFFYSLVFWDHSLVSMLVLLAVAIAAESPKASPRRLAGAGALLGVAAWFRPEIVVAVPALAAALMVAERDAGIRRNLALAAGASATLLPLLVFNRLAYGSLFGPHVLVASRAFHAHRGFAGWIERREAWASLLIAPPWKWGLIAIAVLAALRTLWPRLRSPRGRRGILVSSTAILAALGVALFFLERTELESTLLVTAPLALLALLPPPRRAEEARDSRRVRPNGPSDAGASAKTTRLLALFALFDVALVFLTVSPDGGDQWGPRILMPAVVPLVIAGYLRAAEWTRASMPLPAAAGLLVAFAVLAGAGMASEMRALKVIAMRNRDTSALAAAVGASGQRVVVCSDTVVTRFLTPLGGHDRLLFRAENAGRLAGLEALLRKQGFERLLLIDFARYPVLAPSVDNPDFPREGPPTALPKGYQMTTLRIR